MWQRCIAPTQLCKKVNQHLLNCMLAPLDQQNNGLLSLIPNLMCHTSDMSCNGDQPHRTQLESIVRVPVSTDKLEAPSDSQSRGRVLYAGASVDH